VSVFYLLVYEPFGGFRAHNLTAARQFARIKQFLKASFYSELTFLRIISQHLGCFIYITSY
jgi:hypothetical protein